MGAFFLGDRPAASVAFLDGLMEKHGRKELATSRDRALDWRLENPVKPPGARRRNGGGNAWANGMSHSAKTLIKPGRHLPWPI
ncbi:MAG: hypothetical protein QF541_15335 [Lentisphaeria bacterium]|jgi:hypothetical protein|nr:hypothetical protein [Lentisphaeria bacterium]|tara:strand:+ start:102 stop:350 length:249 start_codon:yes stop_codon:yes gene_type:complete